MKNWRQWLKRIGALLRRLTNRARPGAEDSTARSAPVQVEAPVGAQTQVGTETPVDIEAPVGTEVPTPREATPAAEPVAPAASVNLPFLSVPVVEPPTALGPTPGGIETAPAPTPMLSGAVEPLSPAVPAAPEASPQPPPAYGTWRTGSVTAQTGRIDLAQWVSPERTYRIHEPAALAASPCVLVVLHGCRQTAGDIAEGTRLNEHADARGWVVLYPEQVVEANKYGCWNWFDPANIRGEGECALIVRMLDEVCARYHMDRSRAFLAGMSAGGALAALLAARFPDRWVAVAIHSGLPYGAATDPWGALRVMRDGADNLAAVRGLREALPDAPPVPAIILHGSEDAIVHRRNAELLVRQFLGWNGSLATGSDWASAPLPAVDDTPVRTPYGHPYILRAYGGGREAEVRECEVVGMGHAWSGGDSAVPFNDELGPDASALMVEFFAAVAAGMSEARPETLH